MKHFITAKFKNLLKLTYLQISGYSILKLQKTILKNKLNPDDTR